jgi:hypothetical protein
MVVRALRSHGKILLAASYKDCVFGIDPSLHDRSIRQVLNSDPVAKVRLG